MGPTELSSFDRMVLAGVRDGRGPLSNYRLLVDIFEKNNDLDSAAAVLAEALARHDDETGFIRACLALAWAKQGRRTLAVTAYQESVRRSPENLGWLYQLARLHFELGDRTRAGQYLDRLLETEKKTGGRFQRRTLLTDLAQALDRADLSALIEPREEGRLAPLFRQGASSALRGDWLNIEWVLTFACNYNCSYCLQRSEKWQGKLPLPTWPELRKAADNLIALEKSHYQFFFLGGEPTLLPDLAELVRYLKKRVKNMLCGITSNGSRGAGYFSELVSRINPSGEEPIALQLAVSVHAEHFPLADLEPLVQTLSPRALVQIYLMFHPGRSEYIKAAYDKLMRLRREYSFMAYISPLRAAPDFLDYDPRYSKSDWRWLENGNLRLSQPISDFMGDSSTRPLFPQPGLFWDAVVDGQRHLAVADQPWAGRPNQMERLPEDWGLTRGLYCALGSGCLAIYPQGHCYGGQCAEARGGRHGDVYHDRFLEDNPFPFLTACGEERCDCPSNHANCKFRDRREAEAFLAGFGRTRC